VDDHKRLRVEEIPVIKRSFKDEDEALDHAIHSQKEFSLDYSFPKEYILAIRFHNKMSLNNFALRFSDETMRR